MRILLLSLLLMMQTYIVPGRRPAAAAGCSPVSGNLWVETFDATGYDLGTGTPGWTETIDNPATANEDDTAGSPGGCYSGQWLLVTSASNKRAVTVYNSNTTRTGDTWFRFFLRVVSETLSDGQQMEIAGIGPNAAPGTSMQVAIGLEQVATNQLRLYGAQNCSGSVNITTGTQYRIEMRTNGGANTSEIRVNGTTLCTGDTGWLDTLQYYHLGVGTGYTGYAATLRMDHATADSTGWIGE